MATYNLIFHVTAIDHPMVLWHVDTILSHFPLFNGKRVVTIAEVDLSVADELERRFNEAGADVHRLPPDDNWEAAPFFNTSGPIVESTEPDTFLFYGHCKGASRSETECVAIKKWCSHMYKHLLEDFSVVESTFKNPEIHACGIFKCINDREQVIRTEASCVVIEHPAPGEWEKSGWHYPGTFYWVRQSEAFKEGWKFPERHESWHRTSTELWPCYVIPSHDNAADLYPLPVEFGGPEPVVANSLYNDYHWQRFHGETWHRNWKCDVNCVCDSITFQWVNEKKKIVWWEVPRVGSSSLKKTLDIDNNSDWRRIAKDETGDFLYGHYLNFTTVVNPWRRVASCYWLYTHYKMRRAELRELFCPNNNPSLPTFREFVLGMFNEGSQNHHWSPISNYVPPEGVLFDWLHIPLEKLTSEWNVLAYAFDLPLMDREVQTETVNQKPWREYYVNNPDLFNLVASYYEEDLRRFGSSFSSAIITEFGEGKE